MKKIMKAQTATMKKTSNLRPVLTLIILTAFLFSACGTEPVTSNDLNIEETNNSEVNDPEDNTEENNFDSTNSTDKSDENDDIIEISIENDLDEPEALDLLVVAGAVDAYDSSSVSIDGFTYYLDEDSAEEIAGELEDLLEDLQEDGKDLSLEDLLADGIVVELTYIENVDGTIHILSVTVSLGEETVTLTIDEVEKSESQDDNEDANENVHDNDNDEHNENDNDDDDNN